MEDAAKVLDLDEYLERKPKALSGGQRQRVAMGRAIVRNPQAFLMDEPLSNLDAKLRVQTRTEIAALQRRLGVTTVYVTHDQVEAMTMGDRVGVLKDGYLHAGRHPAQPLRPAGQRLRRRLHRLPGDEPGRRRPRPGGRRPRWPVVPAAAGDHGRAGRRTARRPRPSGFRPEAVRFVGEGDGFPFEVVVVEELGSDAYAYGTLHTSARRDVRRQAHDHPRRCPEAAHEGRDDLHHGSTRTRRTSSPPRPDAGSPVTAAPVAVRRGHPGVPGLTDRPPQPRRPSTYVPRRAVPTTEPVSEGVHMRIRSSLTATATLGAVAALTAGCLSSGGGGGGGGNEQHQQHHRGHVRASPGDQESELQGRGQRWAKNNDVTVKFPQTGDFNSLINTRVQGNERPTSPCSRSPGS